ncbi:aquaporin [Nocardia sp. NPDC052566]|uniref:aquaporin n=1 Tax=Nocardia sp. NPDC052566 TaxID=3364330 RepID=UPI0037C4F1CE
MNAAPTLARRLVAEAIGTAALVAVVVGSGIAAQHLSPDNVGLQLLENSTATVFGLAALILLFGPVSGAHFNPAVSLADWLAGRRTHAGLSGAEAAAYSAAQISTQHRVDSGRLVGEIVATTGLIALIFALARTGRAALAPAAVAAWIGAAYWFTSSTSFANPAVTIGRIFTDTFAGIAPTSAPGFIAAQLLGVFLGLGLVTVCYPASPAAADAVVLPHSRTAE